ncbi:MAG: hypothetical protein IPP57_27265 [Candidatus Obscuribacter sp.]|nr:hypothetical protein [Candidatus Obscuribacter sp.]
MMPLVNAGLGGENRNQTLNTHDTASKTDCKIAAVKAPPAGVHKAATPKQCRRASNKNDIAKNPPQLNILGIGSAGTYKFYFL